MDNKTDIPISFIQIPTNENSKEIIIDINFYKGSKSVCQRQLTLDVTNLDDAEIRAKVKTAADWAEKGFYLDSPEAKSQ